MGGAFKKDNQINNNPLYDPKMSENGPLKDAPDSPFYRTEVRPEYEQEKKAKKEQNRRPTK